MRRRRSNSSIERTSAAFKPSTIETAHPVSVGVNTDRAPRFAQGVRPAAEHPLQRSSPSRGIDAGTAGFTGARKPVST
jgi:hypothetical protein